MTHSDPLHDLAALTRDCIHCGLCLESCPTYSLLRREPDSPRGRLHLMQALMEGRLAPTDEAFAPLDRCVGCRACETACPSNVRYGALLEGIRAKVVRPTRGDRGRLAWKLMLDHLLVHRQRMRGAIAPLRVVQRLAPGAVEAIRRRLPRRMAHPIEMLGPSQPALRPIPEWTSARGANRGTVAFLTGCVMDALYRSAHHAAVRMVSRAGYAVWTPPGQTCCGALHLHEGDEATAHSMLRANLDAFAPTLDDLAAIVVDSAGCGAAMKDYGHLLPESDRDSERARRLASKVRDISEFLDAVGIPEPDRPISMRLAYHDACHLAHGQGIRQAPRNLLARIPGLTLVPLAESDWCCGGAGAYTVLQPDLSERLLERKLDHVAASHAEGVVTGNPSCLMQIGMGLGRQKVKLPIWHTMEVLDRAYSS